MSKKLRNLRFLVYESETGTILRAGICPEPMLNRQPDRPSEAVMEMPDTLWEANGQTFNGIDRNYRIEDGEVVNAPQ